MGCRSCSVQPPPGRPNRSSSSRCSIPGPLEVTGPQHLLCRSCRSPSRSLNHCDLLGEACPRGRGMVTWSRHKRDPTRRRRGEPPPLADTSQPPASPEHPFTPSPPPSPPGSLTTGGSSERPPPPKACSHPPPKACSQRACHQGAGEPRPTPSGPFPTNQSSVDLARRAYKCSPCAGDRRTTQLPLCSPTVTNVRRPARRSPSSPTPRPPMPPPSHACTLPKCYPHRQQIRRRGRASGSSPSGSSRGR